MRFTKDEIVKDFTVSEKGCVAFCAHAILLKKSSVWEPFRYTKLSELPFLAIFLGQS